MKPLEILKKILTLDSNKDYNFDLTETTQGGSTVETPSGKSGNPAEGTTNTLDTDTANKIKAMEDEIKTLKSANLALLNQTSVESHEKTTEENLLQLFQMNNPHLFEGGRYGRKDNSVNDANNS